MAETNEPVENELLKRTEEKIKKIQKEILDKAKSVYSIELNPNNFEENYARRSETAYICMENSAIFKEIKAFSYLVYTSRKNQFEQEYAKAFETSLSKKANIPASNRRGFAEMKSIEAKVKLNNAKASLVHWEALENVWQERALYWKKMITDLPV